MTLDHASLWTADVVRTGLRPKAHWTCIALCLLALGACAPKEPPRSAADLQAVVSGHEKTLRPCHEAALLMDEKVQEQGLVLSASVGVNEAGVVEEVTLHGPKHSPGLGECVIASVKSWRFARAEGSSQFSFPLVFGPTSRAKPGTQSSPGSLYASQLMTVVLANRPGLQRCYKTALRAREPLPPEGLLVTLEVVVGESGRVEQLVVKSAGSDALLGCIRTNVNGWVFPTATEKSEFSAPVVFRPQ